MEIRDGKGERNRKGTEMTGRRERTGRQGGNAERKAPNRGIEKREKGAEIKWGEVKGRGKEIAPIHTPV